MVLRPAQRAIQTHADKTIRRRCFTRSFYNTHSIQIEFNQTARSSLRGKTVQFIPSQVLETYLIKFVHFTGKPTPTAFHLQFSAIIIIKRL